MVNLQYILSLFGTDKTRNNFLQLCNQYYGERIRQEASEISGEPVLNSRRSDIHNQIMEIVQKLFLRVMENTPSRKEVGEMILEHLRDNSENLEYIGPSGSLREADVLQVHQDKLVVASTFRKQSDKIIREMVKEGK